MDESPELRARVEALTPGEFWALWWLLRKWCFFRPPGRGEREALYGSG